MVRRGGCDILRAESLDCEFQSESTTSQDVVVGGGIEGIRSTTLYHSIVTVIIIREYKTR